MSTAGQVVGGVVGAVAGFFIGGGPTGALYGAQIGIMAGGYLDPPKGPTQNGPRLNDLSVQTSTYGAVIPRVYGSVTVNGNVFWLENNQIKEAVTKKKSGGKGGGSKTTTRTYTYSATFAVGLCKGPIAGVRRIWIGPDLIYYAGSSDPNTIAASNAAATGFAIYNGTDTQAANSRMQATLGAANTPAWRGLAYIVFYDLALARYANTLAGAQVRVEILQLGSIMSYVCTQSTGANFRHWITPAWCAGAGIFVSPVYGTSIYATSTDGLNWVERSFPVSANWTSIAASATLFVVVAASASVVYTSPDGLNWTSQALPNSAAQGYLGYGNGNFVIPGFTYVLTSANGFSWTQTAVPWTADYAGYPFWSDFYTKWFMTETTSGVTKICTSVDGYSWTAASLGYNSSNLIYISGKGASLLLCGTNGTTDGTLVSTNGSSWTRYTGGGGDFNASGVATDNKVYVITGNGNCKYSADGITWTNATLNLVTATGPCWNGAIFAFLIVSTGGPNTAEIILPTFVSPVQAVLSDIVSAECLQSGLLTSGDIDVTALAAQQVRGYRIGSVGAIRAALEPLQAAWPFDVVQHGYKIQFVMRGGSSVVTIPAADLDARSGGQQPGVQITTAREMDSQLPRRVTVQHLDYDREYNAGTQYAERLNTAAINAQILDLPIVLTATEAAGKAEVLLYLYWLERYDVAANLPPTYNQLEPGDVVTLVTPEGNVSLRLVGINYTSDGRVEAKAKYANPAIYTPTAVGASPPISGPTTITPVGASVYVLMDLPHMSSAQDGPSFLAAMTGALTGWRGGVLMQSTDSGSTWANLHDFGSPGTTLGTCSNSIGSVEHRVIDNASLLTVTLTQGALYSITQLQMFGGANHFAYGVDGRWEIIAAQTCTLVSGTTYTLSNLLRGRFGTEQFMGSHANGDSLVLLDTTDIAAIVMGSGTIGLSYLYRGITLDRDISTDSNRAFTYAGVNLKPLSPIALTGNRDASNDWALSWVRRTRDGGEWRDNVDASLGETSEAYQVDVFSDGAYATVKRTISTTSPAATYTSADQTTDFGGNQGTLYLKIYQMSATVGRGYPLTQSITR